jgi:hypothetical protein
MVQGVHPAHTGADDHYVVVFDLGLASSRHDLA